MPSLAKAYTEFTTPWPPPPPAGGGTGAGGAAGAGAAGGASLRAGVAEPRPRMSGNPWSGSPTIARAALMRLPPKPRPGVWGSRLTGRVAAAVNPPEQSSDAFWGDEVAEEFKRVFQYMRARS